MTIVRYNDFTGTNGASWGAGWTATGGAATIQSNRGELNAVGSYVSCTEHTTGIDLADIRLVGTFRIGNLGEQYPAIGVRHNGAFNPASPGLVDDGIILYLGIDENLFDMQVIVNGAHAESIGAGSAMVWVTNTDYRFTIEVFEEASATRVHAKVWPATTYAIEPEDWSVAGTTSLAGRPASGGVSIATVSGGANNSVISVDNLIIQNINDGRLKVMPIGDSITAGPYNFPGGTGNSTWRRYVYEDFEAGATPLQMVGQNWSDGVADGSGNLGTYSGLGTWDHDHLARNSWTTDDVLAVLTYDIATYKPDIAVIYIGLNDLGTLTPAATASKVADIIDAVRVSNTDVKIVLCQVAPAPSVGADVVTFNTALASLASTMTSSGSPIELADCYTGFDTGWIYDTLHFNDNGDQFVAGKITTAIETLLAGDPDDGWTVFADGTSTLTSATVTGLLNDVEYEFRVRAVNAIGQSVPSNTDFATPVISTTVPDAVGTVTPTSGDGQVILVWSAPANGGSAITDYQIQWRTTAGPGSWNTFIDGTSATTGATVTGLTNGTSYDFQVRALNAVGSGAYSSAVTSIPAGGGGSATYVQHYYTGLRRAFSADNFSLTGTTAGNSVVIFMQTSSASAWGSAATPSGFTKQAESSMQFPDAKGWVFTRDNIPGGTINYTPGMPSGDGYISVLMVEVSNGVYHSSATKAQASSGATISHTISSAAAGPGLLIAVVMDTIANPTEEITTPLETAFLSGDGNGMSASWGMEVLAASEQVTVSATVGAPYYAGVLGYAAFSNAP